MAKRKTKKAGRCKIVTVCGKKRRICWGKKGITSNKPASGGGTRRKARKSRATKKAKCKFGVNKNTGACLKSKRPRRKKAAKYRGRPSTGAATAISARGGRSIIGRR